MNVNGKETILVVEDEEVVRNLAERILRQYGYNVMTASDGVEGIEIFKKYETDISLILLDLTMPKMSGEMVFEKIQEIKQENVNVIISSGHSEDEVRKGILSEAKGYLTKPYTVSELTETVRRILDT